MQLLTKLVSFISPWVNHEGKFYLQRYCSKLVCAVEEVKKNNKALITNHIVTVLRDRSTGMTGLV